MIIILALISLFRYFKHAYSLPIFDPTDGTFPDMPSPLDSSDPIQKRGALDILWSCLATTLSCTWAAVHPNMSFFGNNSLRDRTGRKLYLMLVALLTPELVVAWSYAQFSSARKTQRTISKLYEKHNADHRKQYSISINLSINH